MFAQETLLLFALSVPLACSAQPSPASRTPTQAGSARAPQPLASSAASSLPPTTTAPALAKPKLDAEAPEPKPKPKPEVPEDMALVPAGTFSMGADDEGEMDERPAHSTTVKAFLLDDETGIDP